MTRAGAGHGSALLVLERSALLGGISEEPDRRSQLVGELRAVVRRLQTASDALLLALRPQAGTPIVRWIERRGSKPQGELPFPVALDLDGSWAEVMGAQGTPHWWVWDATGRVDPSMEATNRRPSSSPASTFPASSISTPRTSSADRANGPITRSLEIP